MNSFLTKPYKDLSEYKISEETFNRFKDFLQLYDESGLLKTSLLEADLSQYQYALMKQIDKDFADAIELINKTHNEVAYNKLLHQSYQDKITETVIYDGNNELISRQIKSETPDGKMYKDINYDRQSDKDGVSAPNINLVFSDDFQNQDSQE